MQWWVGGLRAVGGGPGAVANVDSDVEADGGDAEVVGFKNVGVGYS
jgi:hypothetical protein